MNTYSVETRNHCEKTLAWLNKWACARTYGLGSKLPWDPHFLVESLSDSTIYMSYYTVTQLLHGMIRSFLLNLRIFILLYYLENSLDGSKPGPLGITADQMTDEIRLLRRSLPRSFTSCP